MAKALPVVLRGAPQRADGTPEGINLSQLKDWHACGYRWHLRNRRQISRRGLHNIPMDRGSAVHAGIANGLVSHWLAGSPTKLTKTHHAQLNGAVRRGVDAWAANWRVEQEKHRPIDDADLTALMDLIEISTLVAARALTHMEPARMKILTIKKNLPLIEVKLEIDVGLGVPFYGTADVVWQDREAPHGIWVEDYKVREQMQAVEHEETDIQLPGYQYMLAEHGILTTGSIKRQIRAELPRQPQVNKDKSMSRREIISDWPTYQQALLDHGLDPADYVEEMQPKLERIRFHQVDRLYRNQMAVQAMWDKVIIPMAKRWLRAKRFHRTGMFGFRTCQTCWAKDFCLAELYGDDTDFLLQTDYVDATAPAMPALAADQFELIEDA